MKRSLIYSIIELIALPLVKLMIVREFKNILESMLLGVGGETPQRKTPVQLSKARPVKRLVERTPTLIQSLLPTQHELLLYQPVVLNPRNPKLAQVLKLTSENNRLNNFGLQAAMGLPEVDENGLLIIPTILEDPKAAFMFNKDFRKILKKTLEKLGAAKPPLVQ